MFNVFRTRVSVQVSEPTRLDAEGLVIPANDHLWMGSGSGVAIKRAGGEEIEVDAVRQGPVALGSAVATSGGTLSFRRVYHAVVMGQDLKVRHEQIRPALTAALRMAVGDKLSTLVISAVESEELSRPFHEAAREVVAVLFDELGGPTSLQSVSLAVQKAESRDAYRQAFLAILGEAGSPEH